MTNRVWNGGTNDWFTAADWTSATGINSAPLPGDVLTIASGTVELLGAEARQAGTFDDTELTLGSTNAASAPTMLLSSATTGHFFDIASGAGAGFATIDVTGAVAVEGTIDANASGGMLSIGSGASGSKLYLLHGGTLEVTGGDTLHLTAAIEAETTAFVDSASSFVNDGTYAINNANITFAAGASLTGVGTFEPGLSASVTFLGNVVPATQTITFNGADGRLRIASPSDFAGRIANFAYGDIIDLTNSFATGASFDPASHLLTVMDNAATIAAISVIGTIDGTLTAISDGGNGTYIAFAGQPSRTAYEVDEADVAMRGDVARAAQHVDGTGITIGILSDSFNVDGNADTEAAAGYLPANADGTSAVTILKEGPNGSGDEGRAMAELIHQVAPGAAIDFYTAANGQTDFAAGVNALVGAGANIIVDDWSFFGEPFYQVSGAVDTAISNAVAAGVNYFTSAGNFGNASFEASWNPVTTTLSGVSGTVSAMRFSNDTPYQTITLLPGVSTYITLEWDAAFPTRLGVPDSLTAVLYDSGGNVVANSTQLQNEAGQTEPAIQIAMTPSGSTPTDYQLAIYHRDGTPAVSQFKYVLFGSGGGTNPGGIIDDPAAEAGSGTVTGHALVPGVNTVGAIQWPNSPALGNAPVAPEYYSASGPGTLLFDASGRRLATPVADGKVTFLAPDGPNVAVPGFNSSFYGTSAAAPNAAGVAALMLQADPSLTPSQVTSILSSTAQAGPGVPAGAQGAGLIRADLAVQQAAMQAMAACYASQTRLRTPVGERPIECLRPGDLVLTASGEARPVRWIGHRVVDCRGHPYPDRVNPVRIVANAFAPGVPSRDLLLSPDHAVAWEGALIPIRALVNGATIIAEAVERIAYYHVELDRHDLVLAEGLAAESYLDTGNRCAFDNGGPALALHPDFARDAWAAGACAPQILDGAPLHAARATLLARAAELGHALTSNPVLRVLAADRVLHPSTLHESSLFRLPHGTKRVRIASRTRVPAEVDATSDDRRRLGVPVARLTLDRVAVLLDDPRRGAGWHPAEPDRQWTDGCAELVCDGARWLEIFLARTGSYWATRAPDLSEARRVVGSRVDHGRSPANQVSHQAAGHRPRR